MINLRLRSNKGDKMRVGQILNNKAGDKYYFKADADIVLKKGDVLWLNKPVDDINGAVERGKLTREQADAKIAKIPNFVKYNVNQNLKTNGAQSAENF
jgi:hypothetical protein